MALSGELAKYIGNEMIKTGGKELAKAGAKSALSSLVPSVATKATIGGLSSKLPRISMPKDMMANSMLQGEFYENPDIKSMSSLDELLGMSNFPKDRKDLRTSVINALSDNNLDDMTAKEILSQTPMLTRIFSNEKQLAEQIGSGRLSSVSLASPSMLRYKDLVNLYGGKTPIITLLDVPETTKNGIYLDEGDLNTPTDFDMRRSVGEHNKLMKKYLEDNEISHYDYGGFNDKSWEDTDWNMRMNQGRTSSGYSEGVADLGEKSIALRTNAIKNDEDMLNDFMDMVLEKARGDGGREWLERVIPGSSEVLEKYIPKYIPVEQSSSLSSLIPVKRKLYRGQQYSNTDFSYNSELMNENPDKWGSKDVGKGYHFTPRKDMAGSWEGSDGGVLEIDYTPDQVLKADDARKMIEEANKLLADGKYMAKLWQENEAMAEQIEKIADGNLEALAKREGKPFVQHLKANDDELGTMYYYKDIDPELTDRFVSEFKKKAEKYMPSTKPNIQQSKVELSPQQQEFFKDSVVRDENGELMPMFHGTRGDFTVFGEKNPSSSSNSKSGVGYWFTPSEEGAKNFASSIWYGDGEPKAMKTYLNMKNPKVYESVDNSKAVESLRKELDKIELKSKTMSKPKLYYKNMYDYSVAYNMVNQGDKDMAIKWLADKSSYDEKTATELIEEIDNMKMLEDEKKRIQDEISELKYGDAYERFRTDIYKVDGQTAEDANVGGIGMALRDDSSVQKYVDNLKAEGYDGIIIKGTNYDSDTMGGVNDQYVVFEPEQIKNVDNKRPTKNKDIRYAIAAALGIGSIIGPYMNSQKSVDNIE